MKINRLGIRRICFCFEKKKACKIVEKKLEKGNRNAKNIEKGNKN